MTRPGSTSTPPPSWRSTSSTALVDDPEIVDRLAAAIGLSDQQLPLTELFWGARRFLEVLAADRPLVVVIDDIHWAEPTFLDLLEHLTENLADARVLVLATARHDLLEARPDLGTGGLQLTRQPRKPVGVPGRDGGREPPRPHRRAPCDSRSDRAGVGREPPVRGADAVDADRRRDDPLLGWLVAGGQARRARISPSRPPSRRCWRPGWIGCVREERAVLEPAAVIGVEFPTPAVTDLAPEAVRPQVGSLLGSLTEKQLVRPTGSVIVGYRFTHQLIRDTTYQAILKRAGPRSTSSYADWLTAHESDRLGEVEEVIAYHLEQAHLNLQGLGPLDDRGRALAGRAAARLLGAPADEPSPARTGMPLSTSCGVRSAWRRTHGRPRGAKLLLAEALDEIGAYAEAGALLEDIESSRRRGGDGVRRRRARLLRIRLELAPSPGPNWAARALSEADRALPIIRSHRRSRRCLARLATPLSRPRHHWPARARRRATRSMSSSWRRQAGDERQRLRGISQPRHRADLRADPSRRGSGAARTARWTR